MKMDVTGSLKWGKKSLQITSTAIFEMLGRLEKRFSVRFGLRMCENTSRAAISVVFLSSESMTLFMPRKRIALNILISIAVSLSYLK